MAHGGRGGHSINSVAHGGGGGAQHHQCGTWVKWQDPKPGIQWLGVSCPNCALHAEVKHVISVLEMQSLV